jgi:hypothetical protein
MEANDDAMTQTSGGIGIGAIMELNPGPMPTDHFNKEDPKNCDTGTICYDLVPSPLVASDHMISAFQQGH